MVITYWPVGGGRDADYMTIKGGYTYDLGTD